MDNLLQYLKKSLKDCLVVSGEGCDLLVWGYRQENDIILLGISANIPCNTTISESHKRKIETGKYIAEKIQIPFLFIRYPLDININLNGKLIINGTEIEIQQASSQIQYILGTKFQSFGTAKYVNKSTNDPFHEWARINLPSDYIRVDLDAIICSSSGIPKILLEIKRSTKIPVKVWKPYKEDARNYLIHMRLCEKCSMRYYTLNHNNLNVMVTNDTEIGIYKIDNVSIIPLKVESRGKIVKPSAILKKFQEIISSEQ